MSHEVDLKDRSASADGSLNVGRALLRDAELAIGLNDEPGKVAKAEPVLVRPDMTVAQAAEAIVLNCIEHFRSNEPIVAKRKDASALHQMRVSMRRLRAAFSLFGPALADGQFDDLRKDLRWFTSQLGEARNLDVFLTQKRIPGAMRELVRAERDKAYSDVIAILQSDRVRLLLIDLVAWVELGSWRQNSRALRPVSGFVARRLYKWWQKIARHGDLKSTHANERHELRIETKKLRYALDFVRSLHDGAGRKQKEFSKAIESLQESLGKLNDLATARAIWSKFGQKPIPSKMVRREVEQDCLLAAQASIDRLRKIGPYWTRLA